MFEGCQGHPELENTEFFLVRVCVSHCYQEDGIAEAATTAQKRGVSSGWLAGC